MTVELINLTDWPTMPAPMQSPDAGEAWVWGDFVAILQRKPTLMGQAMQAMAGKQVTQAQTMEYPYAMMVFYNKAKNPHGRRVDRSYASDSSGLTLARWPRFSVVRPRKLPSWRACLKGL